MDIIREAGHIPSVAEVAARSRVSRATAYRYFPSRSVLITAVIDRSLGPVRSFKSKRPTAASACANCSCRPFRASRSSSRRCAPPCNSRSSTGRSSAPGLLEEETYRRGHRVRILEHAIAPLASQMPKAVRCRLHRALSVIFGIEPWVVLKDIWGIPDREVERIALWMADAMIDAAAATHRARRSAACGAHRHDRVAATSRPGSRAHLIDKHVNH